MLPLFASKRRWVTLVLSCYLQGGEEGFELCQHHAWRPVGKVKNPGKSWHILPRDWQILLKICQVSRLQRPPPPHHETWPGFLQRNVLTHNRHCGRSAAVLALAAFSSPWVFSCAWGGKMHYVGLELSSLSPPCSSNTFLSSWMCVCVCVHTCC